MGRDINGIPVLQDERLIRLIADIHKVNSSQKVCFIIGAGASISSGIRSGERLSTEWLKEIKEDILEEADYADWVNKKNINEEYPGENYSDIYIQRFEDSKNVGYDFINHEMQGKEPNIGYLLLGELLNYKEHNIVITTNFDNLIERSLYTYQSIEPLVCAHENMAVYARPADKRPLIAKIHRDKLFDPINDPEGLNTLAKNWVNPLTELFNDKIVVCIGYGGNDGSLMGLLKNVNLPKGLYWCIMPKAEPPQKVDNLLKEKNGKYVEITGFDEFVFKLWSEISKTRGSVDFEDKIDKLNKDRKERFGKAIIKLRDKSKETKDAELDDAFETFAKTQNLNSWWDYELKVRAAKTNEEKEQIYKKGLEKYPKSPELNNNYAVFLQNIRKDYDAAEKYYKKALELESDAADFNGNYANFLKDIRKDYDAAEKYYKKALELEPNSANKNNNYAIFLQNIRKDYDAAETHYKKALELESDAADFNGNYANFLKDIRKDYDAAEKYYKKALELEPNSANKNSNYAIFLQDIRKDYDVAEKHYKKALELESDAADFNGNYANFLKDIRKDYDAAEKHYKKALELEPENASFNGNYAIFLQNIRKDYDVAEKHYKKALELEPENASFNGNYAVFLQNIRKDYDVAEKHYKKALELESENASFNGNYAIFLQNIRKDYDVAEKYYKKALNLDPESPKKNSNYAVFLKEILKDYDTAEKHLKKSLEIESENLLTVTNYIELLCEGKKVSKAITLIEEGKKLAIEKNNEEYLLVISYFEYSLNWKNNQIIKASVENLLQKGITHTVFNFKSFLDSMEKQKHPKFKELKYYAERINGKVNNI